MSRLSFLLTLLLSFQVFANDVELPSLNIDPQAISISGISSGAFMAVQMGVAFSETFMGIGSVAGGIYSCALGQPLLATEQCMKNPASIQVDFLVQHTKNLAQYQYIDPIQNLEKQRIYIFSSVADSVVQTEAGHKLAQYYSNFIPDNQILFENTPATEHGFPTVNNGSPCNFKGLPWILNCNFDMAERILKSTYGKLKSKSSARSESLQSFTQTDFGGAFSGLENDGWVYVPKSCESGLSCKLHIALHGCQMSASYIQDQFVNEAGYNDWAEANRIVVLYPQALKNGLWNPNGCWDWFGYTGLNYTTKYGPQMSALMKMIQTLQGR